MAPRDKSQTVQVGLRIKEPLRAALEEAARDRGVSMNAEIVRRLDNSLRERIDPEYVWHLIMEATDQMRSISEALFSTGQTLGVQEQALTELRINLLRANAGGLKWKRPAEPDK